MSKSSSEPQLPATGGEDQPKARKDAPAEKPATGGEEQPAAASLSSDNGPAQAMESSMQDDDCTGARPTGIPQKRLHYRCPLCNMWLNGAIQLRDHEAGKKHGKAVEREMGQKMPIDGPDPLKEIATLHPWMVDHHMLMALAEQSTDDEPMTATAEQEADDDPMTAHAEQETAAPRDEATVRIRGRLRRWDGYWNADRRRPDDSPS